MKKLFVVCFAFFASIHCFAQELAEQRMINICENRHSYDFSPYTASYTAEAQLFTGLYEGLFSYDPVTLEPVNAICSSYKISRDKRRWTFLLRDNAKFSDGTPINAKVIKQSWINLIKTPGAPFASLLDCIMGAEEFKNGQAKESDVQIEVRDELTLVVRLKEPQAHLAKILCHHAFSAVSENPGVYSGAFVLESADENLIVMKKNEFYHDAESVKIPGINVYLTDDYPENAYKYNDEEFDWVCGNADSSKILNKDAIHVSAEFGSIYLFFKPKNSPWDKAEFRNALIEAVPYDELRKNYSVKAESFIYPLSGYPKVNGISDYDEKDALYQMMQARKKYGIPENEVLPLVFAITEDEYLRGWAEMLKAAWKPLGVDLIVQKTTAPRYNPSIPSWNADLFYYSWIGDFADPLAFLELFRTGSSLNVAGYSSEKFDQLLHQSSCSDSYVDQYKLLSQAEQMLLDDGEIIPVAHPVSMHVVDTERVGGWQANALDIHPLKYLYLKEVKPVIIPNLVMF